MKSYRNYTETTGVPSGVEVRKENGMLRLFFDFEESETKDMEGNVVTQLMCEHVEVSGNSYGDIVNAIIKDRYPDDVKDAIILDKGLADDSTSSITDEKRKEYLQKYADFQAWREHAKAIAKEVLK